MRFRVATRDEVQREDDNLDRVTVFIPSPPPPRMRHEIYSGWSIELDDECSCELTEAKSFLSAQISTFEVPGIPFHTAPRPAPCILISIGVDVTRKTRTIGFPSHTPGTVGYAFCYPPDGDDNFALSASTASWGTVSHS